MRAGASTLLVLALALATAHATVASVGFRPPRDCGRTIFRDGDVRPFRTAGTIDGEQAWRHHVCSARIRAPRRFNEISPGTDEQLSTFRRSGPRVAFVITLAGGESFDQLLGTSTCAAAAGGSRACAGATRARPCSPSPPTAAAARLPAGPVRRRCPAGRLRPVRPNGGLGVPRPRALVTGTRVVPGSIAVAAGTITWTTRSGEAGSAPSG